MPTQQQNEQPRTSGLVGARFMNQLRDSLRSTAQPYAAGRSATYSESSAREDLLMRLQAARERAENMMERTSALERANALEPGSVADEPDTLLRRMVASYQEASAPRAMDPPARVVYGEPSNAGSNAALQRYTERYLAAAQQVPMPQRRLEPISTFARRLELGRADAFLTRTDLTGPAAWSSDDDEIKSEDMGDDVLMHTETGGVFRAQRPANASSSIAPSFDGPEPCCWLSSGAYFKGQQRNTASISQRVAGAADAQQSPGCWSITLRVHQCDWGTSFVCGTMDTETKAGGSIVTYWEAEIVDNAKHTFLTDKWGASQATDIDHWSRLTTQFTSSMRADATLHNGKCRSLSSSPCLFLRLKEQAFVNAGSDCGLTISGFYYMVLDRSDGSISGYYFDPHTAPYQSIDLKPDCPNGMAFGSVDFA